jgi:SAM-dependent methyltransferase
MSEGNQREHLEQLAEIYSEERHGLYAALDETSNPQGPRSLNELALGILTTGSRILDAGCRNAAHLIQLTSASGCTGVGIDPLLTHVQQAIRLVDTAGVGVSVTIERGIIERLPHRSASFDFVWCRDVLTLVDDLDLVLIEFKRVLSSDGHILIYLNTASDLLEPLEADRLNRPLGNVAANMQRERIEHGIARAGLAISDVREIGTEWREYEEERTRPVSDDLLKLARLRRRKGDLVSRFGQEAYDSAEASLHWLCYQLLGKLKPMMYVLRHA